MRRAASLLCLSLTGAFLGTAQADNDPRDYLPFPDGTNLFTLYYQYARGKDLYGQGSKIAKDYDLATHIWLVKGTTYREIASRLFVFQAGLPMGRADLDWDSAGFDEETSGFGDPIFLTGFWPYADREQRLWWGLSGWVTVPAGNYDKNKALNLGANRWSFKAESNVTYGIQEDLFLELTAGLTFYTENDDYLYRDTALTQAPVFVLEGHVSKDLSSTLNVSVDYFFHYGGETTIGGVNQNNTQNDHALQGTVGFLLGEGWWARLVYRNDFHVNNGPQTQTVGFRLIKPF